MKSYARLFLAFACLVISVAALFNVFSDNDDVRAKAKDVGCTKACDLAEGDRTPFAQTFKFRSTNGMVTVRCARAAIFFGDYACEKQ